jgi:hypothetical protein
VGGWILVREQGGACLIRQYMLLRIYGVYYAPVSQKCKRNHGNQENYFRAAFLPNTLSFALALFPPPDLVLPTTPNALALFVFETAANFTCFSFVEVVGSTAFLEDLRIVLVSGGLSPFGFAFIGAESFAPSGGFRVAGFGVVGVLEARGVEGERLSSILSGSKKSSATGREDFGFDSLVDVEDLGAGFFVPFDFSVEISEDVGFLGADSVAGGSGPEACKGKIDFLVEAADFFRFFPDSSSDSRARFFPFFTSSFASSGIGTRVKPSHLPPSSSSSLQLQIGRLALELVFTWID